MKLHYLKKNVNLLILIIISTALDLYILRDSITIGIVQSADWPIPITNLNSFFYYLFPAWSYQNMSSNGANIFLITYDLISSITNNPATIQKIFYYIPWALTPFSAYILLKFLEMRRGKIFFSLLYQFGPWITGQFMDGEPINVMLYLFIPLIFYVMFKFYSDLPKLYTYLTMVMMVPSFFSLEAPFFYIILISPLILYFFWYKGIKYTIERTLIISASFLTIILFNIYSLLPYVNAYSSASSSISSTISSFINFPPAVIQKYWLLLFVIYLVVLTSLLVVKDKRNTRIFFLFFTIISVFLAIIYPGLISNYIGIYIITKIPILAPFINPSEFLLYIWIELFVIVVYSFTLIDLNILNNAKNKVNYMYKAIKQPAILIIAFGIAILLISSATIEIQSFGSHDTDVSMLSQGAHFDKTEIKPQYEYLLKYLESHGASYNLGFHTIIFPENPSSTLPFYIGSEMIPGYEGLFNYSISTIIINGINSENSSFLMLLSVLGIKYMAVMNIPASTWYGTNSTPQLGYWGDKSMFIGNYTYYLKDLNNITGVKNVYKNNGLWLFENKYYKSPILESNYSYINDVLSGNFNQMYTVKNVSGNFLNKPEWFYSGGNYTLNSDLNLTLYKSTSDLLVYNYTSILPNATYELSFNFSTTGTASLYYGSGQNAAIIFYNVTKSCTKVIGVTVITIAPENVANNTYSAYFKTPDYSSILPTEFLIQLQPPVKHNKISVSITNLSLREVKIINNFNRYFLQVPYKFRGLTTLKLFNVSKDETIILDESYGPGWYIKGTHTELTKNNIFGLMQLNSSGLGTFTIYYKNQNYYNYLLILSFGSIITFLATSTLYGIKKSNIRKGSK